MNVARELNRERTSGMINRDGKDWALVIGNGKSLFRDLCRTRINDVAFQ